jgi:hypothetical protein
MSSLINNQPSPSSNALLNSIDRTAPPLLQHGEKGHAEYSHATGSYSSSFRERITQFSFQVTRTSTTSELNKLKTLLYDLLRDLKQSLLDNQGSDYDTNKAMAKATTIEFIVMLYKMIGHTRDIIDGKGEYTLTYMMIFVWDKFWPDLAKHAVYCCVSESAFLNASNNASSKEVSNHPFGSWKDIKYLCTYLKINGHDVTYSPLINYCINLINDQIRADVQLYVTGHESSCSLAAKWAPREKSARFGWLFTELARAYFYIYECTSNTSEAKARAILKCKTDYRKLLASLNSAIGTVQMNQCANEWASIVPESQTSITMHRQKNAFLNKTKKGQVRHALVKDRIDCAQHFEAYIAKAVKGEVTIKGARIGLNDFTKQAIEYLHYSSTSSASSNYESQIQLLNAQWRDSSSKTGSLGNMIAMVDVSGSMSGDPLNCAIALGVRVAEKSVIGPRVLTFSASPSWVNLEQEIRGVNGTDFVACVKKLQKADWGMNTNFYAALEVILNSIVSAKLVASDVENMVLAVFSDMQIDAAVFGGFESEFADTMMEKIEAKYAEAGVKVCGTPYKSPHILFWNLRSTTGFPTLSSKKNCSMMSGFSPALLNSFCEEGVESLYSCTPYDMLKSQLDNPRYLPLQTKVLEVIYPPIFKPNHYSNGLDNEGEGNGWV